MTHITGGHRYYVLQRDIDTGGISGTGPVAYLVELLGDGIDPGEGVLMMWDTTVDLVDIDGNTAPVPTCGIEWLPDLEMVHAIHGHGGSTRIVPITDALLQENAEDLLFDAVRMLRLVMNRIRFSPAVSFADFEESR